MKTSPLSPNVTVTEGTQTSPLSHRKGPSIQKGRQLVHRAIFCFFGQPRCLLYFQPLNYTSKTQRWPSPTTSNMYYLRVCRKPPQHSSHLLSSHSPELLQQPHTVSVLALTPPTLLVRPMKTSGVIHLSEQEQGHLLSFECISRLLFPGHSWVSSTALLVGATNNIPDKTMMQQHHMQNTMMQKENSVENIIMSYNACSYKLVLRWRG